MDDTKTIILELQREVKLASQSCREFVYIQYSQWVEKKSEVSINNVLKYFLRLDLQWVEIVSEVAKSLLKCFLLLFLQNNFFQHINQQVFFCYCGLRMHFTAALPTTAK